MMIVMFNNILSVIALLALVGFIGLVRAVGSDERGTFILYKLFRFLFILLFALLAFIILFTAWITVEYITLRSLICTTASLTVIVGLCYLLFLRKKFS